MYPAFEAFVRRLNGRITDSELMEIKTNQRLREWLLPRQTNETCDYISQYFAMLAGRDRNTLLMEWLYPKKYTADNKYECLYQLSYYQFKVLDIILTRMLPKIIPESSYLQEFFTTFKLCCFQQQHIDALNNPLINPRIEKFIYADSILLPTVANLKLFADKLTFGQYLDINSPLLKSYLEKSDINRTNFSSLLICNINSFKGFLATLKAIDSHRYDLSDVSNEYNCKHILRDNRGIYDDCIKVMAFFLLYRHAIQLNDNDYFYELFSLVRPITLKRSLQKIINKNGASGFWRDNPISLGFEIEYSDIPQKYARLLQNCMELIQEGWHHPGDGSVIESNNECYGGEATSPIITCENDYKIAMLNVNFLEAMGALANPSCGFHVHIGVRNLYIPLDIYNCDKQLIPQPAPDGYIPNIYQFEFMRQFILIYLREKSKINRIERSYNPYSRVLYANAESIKCISHFEHLVKLVNPDEDKGRRYHEVNLCAFAKHGTIEVRRFAGVTQQSQIHSILSMLHAMAKEAQLVTNHIFRSRLFGSPMKIVDDELDDEVQIIETEQDDEVQIIENDFDDEVQIIELKPEDKEDTQHNKQKKSTKKHIVISLSDSMHTIFYAQKRVAQQIELMTMRINPLLEYEVQIVKQFPNTAAFNKNKPLYELGIVYLQIVEGGNINYLVLDRTWKEIATGNIDHIKLHVPHYLLPSEKNKILLTLAERGHVQVSERVSKSISAYKDQLENLMQHRGRRFILS